MRTVGLHLAGEKFDVRLHARYCQSQNMMQMLPVNLDLPSVFITFMREKVCSLIYVLSKSVDIFIVCFLMFGYVSFGRAA